MRRVDTVNNAGYALQMQPGSEKILVEQARNGNQAAFTQLVESHSEKTLQLAWRLVGNRSEAEEIAQEALLRLYKSLPTFRGDSSLGTWLYRTVCRLAIDHLRREKLRRKLLFFRPESDEQIDPLELAADNDSPHELLVARQTAQKAQRLLNRLPVRQRTVFVLRHQEGLPLKEIATLLDLSEGTVKTHLHRAVNQFRQELLETKEPVS